jgi:hypothetical protein
MAFLIPNGAALRRLTALTVNFFDGDLVKVALI